MEMVSVVASSELIVSMDDKGRIVLPKIARSALSPLPRKCLVYVFEDGSVKLIPVKNLDEIAGSMPDLDLKGFLEEHRKER